MTQYHSLNVKLSTLQLNKLKSGIKNGTEVTLKLSTNVIDDSSKHDNNCTHNLFLINTKVSKLRQAFGSRSSVKIKLSKAHLHKIGEQDGFLSRLLGPLLKLAFSEKCTKTIS